MKILIVEDDQVLSGVINQVVNDLGYEAVCPSTYREGIDLLWNEKFNVVIIELSPIEPAWHKRCNIPDGQGCMSYLPIIRGVLGKSKPIPEFIFVSREGFPEEAKFAIDNGAVDYIQAPVIFTENRLETNADGIRTRLIKALKHAIRIANGSFFKGLDLDGIVGQSWKMKRALLRLAQAARTDENVLIIGEAGTGKRDFAEKIHQNSRWKTEQLVIFDCKGATGSEGYFELFCDSKILDKIGETQTGTLLIYGIDNLNESVQGKLFWHLQDKIKNKSVPSNSWKPFRLICTANADIENSITKGNFRNDLYYEVSTFSIDLPPLRERTEDISELVRLWLANYCEKLDDRDEINVSSEFIKVIESYDWPGNLLEFNNALNFAVTKNESGKILETIHLPSKIQAIGTSQQVLYLRHHERESLEKLMQFTQDDEQNYFKMKIGKTKKHNDAKAVGMQIKYF